MFDKLKERFRIWKISRKPIRELVKPTLKERVATVADTAVKNVPGGGITLTAVVLTVLGIVMGHLMATASVAGIVMSVSIACLYSGAKPSFKKAILWACAHFGWYLDVLVTLLFTVLGFHLGATLGVVGMVLGLHVSMMMSIARDIYARQQARQENLTPATVIPISA